jgi:hypothetical protein
MWNEVERGNVVSETCMLHAKKTVCWWRPIVDNLFGFYFNLDFDLMKKNIFEQKNCIVNEFKIVVEAKRSVVSLLRRSMIEKYSSKSIDDKRLISIKFNLIYWSEYWLFDVLQLTSIEIYLYSTIYEMNSFDVELDSYLSRFHVVKWISRNEIFHESFNKTFVLRFFVHFVIRSLKVWAWSLNRWVRLIED